MRFESRTALTLMRLRQAQDDDKIAHIRAELEAIRLHLKARREEKYSPEQPRDELGRWTNGGGGAEQSTDDANSTTEAAFGTAPDGTPIDVVGTSSFNNNQQGMTVQEFKSAYCLGRIREVMPGQFDLMTIAEVIAQANKGDSAARRCLKLLGRPEYRK
jgi:hypothetical protein